MITANKRNTLFLSLTVFILFFAYYFATSSYLPHGAGPDWKSNTDVAEFIYKHERLPVLPDDEESLHFTVYGGTRAFRPPLSYIVSATVARSLDFADMETHIQLRKGSALLCALAVALTFYALAIYTGSYGLGLLGALLIGLMPQFTFIASYNNDDSGAIFSAALMIAVLVRIYRYGISNTNAALLGLAGGLVILSKMTAWLLAPLVLVFLAIFVRTSLKSLLRYAAIAGVVFVFSGGWWFIFNMHHYGLGDPFQFKIAGTVIEEHSRLSAGMGVGYASKGIGFHDLVVENYRNFLGETAKATIGNLDWLRLRVGPLQYAVYMSVFFVAMFYYLLSLVVFAARKVRGREAVPNEHKQVMFESLLFLAIIFQLYMYVWTNINNDIQIQGKYIIPVLPAVLLLFVSALNRMFSRIHDQEKTAQQPFVQIGNKNAARGLWLAAYLFIVLVHLDALVNYVVPFYNPPLYHLSVKASQSISSSAILKEQAIDLEVASAGDALLLRADGVDPKLVMGSDICRYVRGNVLLRISLVSEEKGALQVFLDEGEGFSERRSYKSKYSKGSNVLLIPIKTEGCARLRIDPFVNTGVIVLESLEITALKIRPVR